MALKLLFFDKNNGDRLSTDNPKKDLMALLVERTEKLGHMLSFAEATEDPEMVQPNNYAFYFGSFGEAAKIAWRKAKLPNKSSDGLTEYGRKVVESLRKTRQLTGKPYRREVNWMSELQKREYKGKNARYNVETVKESLVDFYNRTGRLPNQSDTRKYDSGLPSWGTMIKFLGPKKSWIAVVGGTDTKTVSQENEAITEVVTTEIPTTPNVATGRTDTEEATTSTPQEETVVVDPPETSFAVPQQSNDGVKVETAHQEQDNLVTIEVKITLPDREKPVLITLTV